MFSSICALPSPASAAACAALFGWFTGTTAQSRLLQRVHVRRSACGLHGPAFTNRRRRTGDLPVLVHVVSQRGLSEVAISILFSERIASEPTNEVSTSSSICDTVGGRRSRRWTRSLLKSKSSVQSKATRTFFSKRGNLLR